MVGGCAVPHHSDSITDLPPKKNLNCYSYWGVRIEQYDRSVTTCADVNVTTLTNITSLQNVTVDREVTRSRDVQVCVQNGTAPCEPERIERYVCGTRTCGWLGCCTCSRYCNRVAQCAACAEYNTASEEYQVTIQVVVLQNVTTEQNVTTLETQCTTTTEFGHRAVRFARPNNCQRILTEDRSVSQNCVNGVCSGAECVCAGWAGDDCGTDINECSSSNGGCETTCTNSDGSFACTCNDGYALAADDTDCDDIDECAADPPGCSATDGTDSVTCTNSDGGFGCACDAGYSLDSSDATSCVAGDCGVLSAPNYCLSGYSRAGGTCRPATIVCAGATTTGQACNFSCPHVAYVLEGPFTGEENAAHDPDRQFSITCATDGNWPSYNRSWCRKHNAPPTNITMSGGAVDENADGVAVATFATVDPDAVDYFQYYLATGGDQFEFDGNTLYTTTGFDYETQTSATITVISIDKGSETINRSFTIAINNVNEPPTAVLLAAGYMFVPENAIRGNIIGTLDATDPESSDSHVFTVLSPSSAFRVVNGATLVFQGSGNFLDFEVSNRVMVTIRATDNGDGALSADLLLRVNVTDSNDPPSLSATAFSVPETASVGSRVGTAEVADEDNIAATTGTPWLAGRATQTWTLAFVPVSLEGTNLNALANLVSNNPPFEFAGVDLTLTSALDFEDQYAYLTNISITDSGDPALTSYAMCLISLSNEAEAPIAINITNSEVNETVTGSNAAVGSTVGTIVVIDEDLQDQVSIDVATSPYFSVGSVACDIVSGSEIPDSDFDDDRTLLRCQAPLVVAQPVLYAEATLHQVAVVVTDNSGLTIITFNISVLNVNEAPNALVVPIQEVNENTRNNTLICELSAADNDAADTFTLALVGSTASNPFDIAGTELIVRRPELLNFEARTSVSFQVSVTDSGKPPLTSVFDVTIEIADLNERITDAVPDRTTFAEDIGVGDAIAQIDVRDPDNLATVRQSATCVLAGTETFYVDGANTIRLRADTIDFERASAYEGLLLECTDSGQPALMFSKSLSFYVQNLNERPSAVTLSATSVPENLPALSFVGQLTTTDPDSAGRDDSVQLSFTYTLVDTLGRVYVRDDPRCPFEIVGRNRLQTTRVLNFEQTPAYEFWVRSSDNGGLSLAEQFTIVVEDVNDVPSGIVAIAPNRLEVVEGTAGAWVANLTVQDEDRGQIHLLQLLDVNANDGGLFVIRGQSLYLASDFAADFEQANRLFIRVQATDNGEPFVRRLAANLEVQVLDLNEFPSAIHFDDLGPEDALPVPENVSVGDLLGRLKVEDPDNELAFEFSAGRQPQTHNCVFQDPTGGSSATFQLLPNMSVIVQAGLLNFETLNRVQLRVRCQDNGSPSRAIVATVLLNVTDLNEPPTALTLGGEVMAETELFEVRENLPIGTVLGVIAVVDPDSCAAPRCSPHQNHTIVLEAGSNPAFEYRDGRLLVKEPLDHETFVAGSMQLRFMVTDDGVPPLGSSFIYEVGVVDHNDRPTLSLTGNRTIMETAPSGFVVGVLVASDQDSASTGNGAHTFSMTEGVGSTGVGVFDVFGNELVFSPTNSQQLQPGITYYLSISVRDNGTPPRVGELEVGILVLNENDAPSRIIVSNNVFVEESAVAGERLATVQIEDPDNTGCSYPCVPQNHTCRVLVTGCYPSSQNCSVAGVPVVMSGMDLVVQFNGSLNYERVSSYTISLNCTDDGDPPLSLAAVATLVVTDTNDVPTDVRILPYSGTEPHVAENALSGFVVGRLVADDEDSVGGQTLVTHRFAITRSATPFLPFVINGGELMVNNTELASLDFEQLRSYTFEVTAVDAGTPPASVSKNLTVTVDDINEPPFSISLTCGCRGHPCQHGSTCVPASGDPMSHTCGCSFGFSGVSCENSAASFGIPTDSGSCLQVHPGLSMYEPIARIAVGDVDTNQFHRITASGIFTVRGNELFLATTLGADFAHRPAADFATNIRAVDPGQLSFDRLFQFAVSPCARSNCSSNGRCIGDADGLSFQCVCNMGFAGDGVACVPQICDGVPCVLNSCLIGPCQNGAQCRDIVQDNGTFSYDCECVPGYAGRMCETRLEAICTSDPCQSGTCVDRFDSSGATFVCECHVGVSGQFCQYDESSCDNHQCDNAEHTCVPARVNSDTAGVQCIGDRSTVVLTYQHADCVDVTRLSVSDCNGRWVSTMEDFQRFVQSAYGQVHPIAFFPLGFTSAPNSTIAAVTFFIMHPGNLSVISPPSVLATLGEACLATMQQQGLCNFRLPESTFAPPATFGGRFTTASGLTTPEISAAVGSDSAAAATRQMATASIGVGVAIFLIFAALVFGIVMRRKARSQDQYSTTRSSLAKVQLRKAPGKKPKRSPVSFMNPAYKAQAQAGADVLYPNRVDAEKRSSRAFDTLKGEAKAAIRVTAYDASQSGGGEHDRRTADANADYLDLEGPEGEDDGYITVQSAEGGSIRGTISRGSGGVQGRGAAAGTVTSVTIDNPLFIPKAGSPRASADGGPKPRFANMWADIDKAEYE